jgi:hypothetical protein
MRRFTHAALALAAISAAGCVEGEQTFTLNPNGSGKVRIDVVMAPPAEFAAGPPVKEKPTLADARLQGLRALLKTKGVAAWKDVSAAFTPDGRFRFAGTAYFDKLDRLEFDNVGPFLGSPFGLTLTGDKGGQLILAPKPPRNGRPGPETPKLFGGRDRVPAEELAKLPDEKVDEAILLDKVQYQASRPLVLACFARGKVTTTFLLPGTPDEQHGFRADGPKLVRTLDGDKAVAGIDAFFARPAADLRGVYRKPGAFDAELTAALGSAPDDACKAVVAKVGPPQFDYDAEVKAARAAYPQLRTVAGLPADFWLPDGNPPPPPKGFGPPPRP